MIYFCCDDNRRAIVREDPYGTGLNGIEYLEVVDCEEPVRAQRQRTLKVFLVKKPTDQLLTKLKALTTANVRITGGERTTGIVVDNLELYYNEQNELDYLCVHVTPRGDYSIYNLALVESNSSQPLKLTDNGKPLLDPQLTSVDFSFKVECPTKFDCLDVRPCLKEAQPSPEIDYLSKDYASFRQLLLDRMSVIMPDWRERNAADLGITLVEFLAYVGDYLSYRQDAIATEAYLGTARQRVSVRRHTRLLDYAMHDGCNARVWVQIQLKKNAPAVGLKLPRLLLKENGSDWQMPEDDPVPGSPVEILRTQFATRMSDGTLVPAEKFASLVAVSSAEVFEPLEVVTLYPEHNDFKFYTWSNAQCCLPKGAVKATLAGDYPNLQPGDVLVFKEVLGPKTGNPADADPQHRHAARLTKVNGKVLRADGTVDDSHAQTGLTDPVTGDAITEIEWVAGDALPFPLCLSSLTESGEHKPDVSIVLGNIVLADHGMTLGQPEPLGVVPQPNPVLAPMSLQGCSHCEGTELLLPPSRFQPCLKLWPVTQAASVTRTQVIAGRRTNRAFDPAGTAASAFDWDMDRVLPAVRLGDDGGLLWLPQRDLLSSDSLAPEFVVEVDNASRAAIRFGDDESGLRPGEGTSFSAVYRVGNGAAGNIGAESIFHLAAKFLAELQDQGAGKPPKVVWHDTTDLIESITNPMPARGGREPQTMEQARQYAPAAFRANLRAVTPDDYAHFAEQHSEAQRTAATLRWTGSWYTVFLTVDRLRGQPVDAEFAERLRRFLEPYRMAGQDLEIDGPQFVPLELEMEVCVAPGYFRSDVEAALMDVFSSRTRLDGTRGFFHPDNFTFGQPVYLSQLYAAAQPVAGVAHLEITKLRRLGTQKPEVPTSGVVDLARLEIARLDHDPNFPDRGVLTIRTKGGR
jgi:hypothetical protein